MSSVISYVYALFLSVTLAGFSPVDSYADTLCQTENIQRYDSKKKGLALKVRKDDPATLVQVAEAMNVRWYYNWSLHPYDELKGKMAFFPMIWGRKAFEEFEASREKYPLILFLNEPDGPTQSNISVDEALKMYPVVRKRAELVVSPATVNATEPWMREFENKVALVGEQPDFVAVHWYGGPNAAHFLEFLEKVHTLYGKPIWITEFAVADWEAKRTGGENKFTQAQIAKFMKKIIPALEELPYVKRYAWFTYRKESIQGSTSALFEPDGQLNRLGKLYSCY